MNAKLLVYAMCASVAGILQAEPFDASGFAKSLDIVVPPASLAQGVTLTDFPALVRLSTSIGGFSYADFTDQTAGSDLAFVDDQGNLIPHEIDTWNTSGETLVWVKVPTLRRGTRLTMYYGNLGYTSAVASTQTWSAFSGVWHMNQSGATVEPDVSGNSLDATPKSNSRNTWGGEVTVDTTPSMLACPGGGVVGSCRVNQTNHVSYIHNYLSVPSCSLGDTFTFSGWFNADDIYSFDDNGVTRHSCHSIVSRKTSAADDDGWHVEWEGWDTNDGISVLGSGRTSVFAQTGQFVGKWMALTFAFSGTTVSVYTNGALCASGTIAAAADNENVLAIGSTIDGRATAFEGFYDEVRLCGGTLSAERIAADYATAANPDFFSYGKDIDPSSFSKFVQITASASAVPDGVVIRDFPALVRLSESIPGFRYSDFKLGNGGDLTFATIDGVVLPHEVDVWDPSGESLVWVKIPAFSNGMVIYAYWGRDQSSGVDQKYAWGGFKGVWHMNQSGSSDEPDVSGNGLDARPTSNSIEQNVPTDTRERMKSSAEGDGTWPSPVVGLYRRNQTDWDGGIHNYFTVQSYSLGDTFTFSGWFNMRHKYGYHRIVTRKNEAKDAGGWHIEWNNYETSNGLSVLGSGSNSVAAPTGLFVDEWMALTFAFKGETVSVYTNGALCASGTVDAVTDNGRVLTIGGTTGSGPSFEGYYDEIRLGAGALSPARIAADYKTIKDPSFFSFGAVGAPAANPPAFETPTVVNDGGTLKISVSMASGACTPYLRFTSGAVSTDVALSEQAVEGAHSYVIVVPDSLVASTTYSFAAVGKNANGGEIVVPGATCFYTGAPTVAKVSDGAENGPTAGAFSVSRDDAHGDLAVSYELSGTAVAGTDYEGAASGTVVIPAGATSATVFVMPKVNAALKEDTTVTLTVADGLYAGPASAATLTIKTLAPVTKRDFKRCVEFTFPMAFLGDGEVLTNFPVLVKVSSAIPGFSYSDFGLAGGRDMMFTDADNNPIPFEIDTWDAEGTSLVWVSVPELKKGTSVRMYYGNGANSAGIDVVGWQGYAGVWHMGEAGGTACDSTTNGLDAVAVQNARAKPEDLVAVADGAVGAARVNQARTTFYDLDDHWGADNRRNYLSAPLGQDLDLRSRFSFSGWFRTTGYTEGGETVVNKRASGYNWGWSIVREHTTWNSDVGYTPDEDVWLTLKVADGEKRLTVPNMRGNWVHLFVSFDQAPTGDSDNPYKTVASVYANGVFLDTVQGSTRVRDNDIPLTFGNINSTTDGQAFSGHYDELRVKAGASTANWAKAEYLTVADPAFVSASPARPATGGFVVVFR